jgi:hypothetical protein
MGMTFPKCDPTMFNNSDNPTLPFEDKMNVGDDESIEFSKVNNI